MDALRALRKSIAGRDAVSDWTPQDPHLRKETDRAVGEGELMVKSGWDDILVEFTRRFGMIAVNRGYVTPIQLKDALGEQFDDDLACRPHRLLGTILFEKNLMTIYQIEQVKDELLNEKTQSKRAVSKKKKI
ncbi:MAG: hypothetical protein WBM29_07700 [Candidatus Deferrimicrobium sp.]